MDIPGQQARSLFAGARVARLATADDEGQPHLVPVTFVVDGESVFFAIDAKPKRTRELRRLRNITANPRVSLLVDEYSEDWRQLWWVRADGSARVDADPAAVARVARRLREKYDQYEEVGVGHAFGPVVEVCVTRWTAWRYAP